MMQNVSYLFGSWSIVSLGFFLYSICAEPTAILGSAQTIAACPELVSVWCRTRIHSWTACWHCFLARHGYWALHMLVLLCFLMLSIASSMFTVLSSSLASCWNELENKWILTEHSLISTYYHKSFNCKKTWSEKQLLCTNLYNNEWLYWELN